MGEKNCGYWYTGCILRNITSFPSSLVKQLLGNCSGYPCPCDMLYRLICMVPLSFSKLFSMLFAVIGALWYTTNTTYHSIGKRCLKHIRYIRLEFQQAGLTIMCENNILFILEKWSFPSCKDYYIAGVCNSNNHPQGYHIIQLWHYTGNCFFFLQYYFFFL